MRAREWIKMRQLKVLVRALGKIERMLSGGAT